MKKNKIIIACPKKRQAAKPAPLKHEKTLFWPAAGLPAAGSLRSAWFQIGAKHSSATRPHFGMFQNVPKCSKMDLHKKITFYLV